MLSFTSSAKPKLTLKRHITLDLCKEVECNAVVRNATPLGTKQTKHVQFCSMLEGPMSAEEWLNQQPHVNDISDFASSHDMYAISEEAKSSRSATDLYAEFLGVPDEHVEFISEDASQLSGSIVGTKVSARRPNPHGNHVDRGIIRRSPKDEGDDPAGGQGSHQRGEEEGATGCIKEEVQQAQDGVRREPQDDSYSQQRSAHGHRHLAVPGQTRPSDRKQPLGSVGGMPNMRGATQLHSGRGSTSSDNPCGSRPDGDGGTGKASSSRIREEGLGGEAREAPDQDRVVREGGLGTERKIEAGIPDEAKERGQRESLGSSRPGDERRRRGLCGGSANAEALDEITGEGVSDHEWLDNSERTLFATQKTRVWNSISTNAEMFDSAKAVRSLRDAVEPEHLWEICCSPESRLTSEAQRQGFNATRWTLELGFDLGKSTCIDEILAAIPKQKPTRLWASPRCTAVSSIQNLNQRDDEQIRALRRKRLRTRKELRHLVKVFKEAYQRNPRGVRIYFEWPKSAAGGWNLPELKELEQWFLQQYSVKLFRVQMDGCMFGLQDADGHYLNKP